MRPLRSARFSKFFARSLPYLIGALIAAGLGCSSSSPYLVPQKEGVEGAQKEIQVLVTPVVTSGLGSEQRGRFGVDLSAYFTAFEVKLINHSQSELAFDPQSFTLTHGETVQHALGGEESLTYYRNGSAGGDKAIVLIEKPYATIRKEMDRIVALQMKAGSVAPKEMTQGLIYFKKVSPDRCKELVLEIGGVTVESTGEQKSFRFVFSCPREG